MERADELEPALASAFAARRPTLVQVLIDREARPPVDQRLAALSFAAAAGQVAS